MTVDCVVVGGGPAGATAATDLAATGASVVLLDRGGRIKPCGGAIPPRLIADFAIPETLLVGRAVAARMVGPSDAYVDMAVDRGGDGFVGMVDRGPFDEWLRDRAAAAGAVRRTGSFVGIERGGGGTVVAYRDGDGREHRLVARCVVGADGARSRVASAAMPDQPAPPQVFAYHEIVRTPAGFDRGRCDVFYQGALSPDFYGWVFPHGDTTSVGIGSAQKGFALRAAVDRLRAESGLSDAPVVRREGAPIPLKPLKRWDDGRAVVLAGDAAGVVAPASGEGIYYAMASGREVAASVGTFLATGDARALAGARTRFMRAHGRVFWVLGVMQHFWYRNDRRRERFVAMCEDRDVQRLIWPAYMNKRIVYADPLAYLRIFAKDMRHLMQTA